jgi:hypothetical protein
VQNEKEPHSKWLTFVAGRAQGLTAVILAMAETHPDPAALLSSLERWEQIGIALAETAPFRDEYIEGIQDVIERVRDHLRRRLESSKDGDSG